MGLPMKLRNLAAALSVAGLLTLAAPSQARYYDDSVIVIENQSDWEIHQLYLSSTQDEEWGADQLGDEVIESGDSYQLHQIPCDDYDVKLVDEDGDVCVVDDVSLCGDDHSWVIDNDDLLSCQAETE